MRPDGALPNPLPPPPVLRKSKTGPWLAFTLCFLAGLILLTVFALLWVLVTVQPRVVSANGKPVLVRDFGDGWQSYRINEMLIDVDLPGKPKNNVIDSSNLSLLSRLRYADIAGYRTNTSYGHISIYYAGYKDSRRLRDTKPMIRAEADQPLNDDSYSDSSTETKDIAVDGSRDEEIVLHYNYHRRPFVRRVTFIAAPGRLWVLRSYAKKDMDAIADKDFDRIIGSWHFLKGSN